MTVFFTLATKSVKYPDTPHQKRKQTMMKRTMMAVAGLVMSSSAMANLVTTDNLVLNPYFQLSDGAGGNGPVDHWVQTSGQSRYPLLSSDFAEYSDGEERRASWGGNTDKVYIVQDRHFKDAGLNLDLIETGLVTMDMSMYVGSSYNDRDRSRMYVTFKDSDGVQVGDHAILGYYDLNSWSYRELLNTYVPQNATQMRMVIHHDRLDGTGNSTGIAAPNVTFNLEDDEQSQMAFSQHGALQAYNVSAPMVLGGLAMLGLMGLRRRK
jgi:hypothetical protein